jgi:CDP-diacylglycerol--glycerol-3-phosphate 3-phosphatidyltransferase
VVTLYELKPRFQKGLRPLVQVFVRAGLAANDVTILACALSFGMGALICLYPGSKAVLAWVPLFMVFRMGLNAIDGLMAREHGMRSHKGAILNELTDVVSDGALYLPFAMIPGLDPRWVVVVVFLSAVSEMAGVVPIAIGASRRYDGPLGKSDRAFAFGLIALVLQLDSLPVRWINLLLALMAALLILTIVNRSKAALLETEREGQAP